MSNQIYNLVYCSRNQIRGTADEVSSQVEQILVSARTNNSKVGVTGALLFNEGLFAQVLEGPIDEVERIFEKIQRDQRHSDVTVLQSGMAESRSFPDWSMAFTSTSGESTFGHVTPIFEKAFSSPSASGAEVLGLLHELVVQEDWMMAV